MLFKDFLKCFKFKLPGQNLWIKYDRKNPINYEVREHSLDFLPSDLLDKKIKTLWFVGKSVCITLYNE